MLIGVLRNSRTAWRNSAAPSCVAASVPPIASMRFKSRQAGAASTKHRLERESAARCSAGTGRRRAASATKAANRTSVAAEAAEVRMARCRSSPNRSRERAPTPASQCCRLSLQNPRSLATTARLSPCRTLASATITTSTLVTLPGRTSYGRTLSRRLQRRQTASATEKTLNAGRPLSLRETRLPVRRGPGAEQREQRQARSCSSTALGSARSASYWLE